MLMLLSILCIIFFFLYIRLRCELRSLHQQLQHHNQEGSKFRLFLTTSNDRMNKILNELNLFINNLEQERHMCVKNEKDVRDMITNISHDIRTPLTSIQGYIEMLQQSEDISEKERYYQIVMKRLNDLESMLDEFFLYTKLMNTSDRFILESKEVYPILCQSVLSYMDLLQSHQLNPLIICDDETIKANIHEESLKRICTNLLMNTIRYGENPFSICIKQSDDEVILIFTNQMKDTSIEVSQIFDRFYKGNEARTQKGSGLGLAIVKELCEHMQGSVTAEKIDQKLSICIRLQRVN